MTTPTTTRIVQRDDGDTALLGALTTTFTPPSSCFPPFPVATTDKAGVEVWNVGFGSNGDENCLPPGWAVDGFYAPGVCPSGYEINCMGVDATTCCPIYGTATFQCNPGITHDKFGCRLLQTLNVSGARTGTYIYAPSVQIQPAENAAKATLTASTRSTESHASSTRPSASDSAPSNTSAPRISTSDVSSSGTPSSSAPSSDSSSATLFAQTGSESASSSPAAAVSGGAIAGIVVGILAALILGALGSFLFFRRSRARKSSSPPPASSSSTSQFPPPPPSVQPITTRAYHELDNRPGAAEMPGSNMSHELGSPETPSRYELDEKNALKEMPSWNEHNPRGPNKPMAWEMPA